MEPVGQEPEQLTFYGFRRCPMKTYAGIDLHSSNNYIVIIDAKDNRLYSKRHDNRLEDVLKVLGKFKATLQGVVVESTYNWYWLVDGLMDNGFRVHWQILAQLKPTTV
jgi:hypothetical protein